MNDSEINLMIGDCINRQSKLTDWEAEFIQSVSQLEILSNRQKVWLEQIWDKVTA